MSSGARPGQEQDGRQEPLGQILKEKGFISEGQVQEALSIQRAQGGVFGEILVGLGYVTRVDVLAALAQQMGLEVVDLSGSGE
jgi:type IV pilus assembly protein PilB